MERPRSLVVDEAPRRSGAGRWIASVVLHASLGAALFAMRPKGGATETVAISMVESKKPDKPKDEPPPPPPPPPPELQPKAKRAAAKAPTPAADPTPPPADAPVGNDAPLFDLAMGNASGGLAVPTGPAAPAAPAAKQTTTSKKTLSAAPAAAKPEEDCPEPPTKPKPKNVLQPSYPEAARAAGISGKVRVEVTVDETGAVKSARVVAGLGHGLDEAALAAARGSTFGPATRCGKSVGGTFVIGMRFSL